MQRLKKMGMNDPTTEEIEGAVQAIIHGNWFGLFPHEVLEVTWVNYGWQPHLPEHSNLYSYWKEQKAKDPDQFFMKDKLDPLEISQVLKNIMLLDCLDEGYDGLYRVYGTDIVNYAKIDWTGRRVSDMNETTKVGCGLLFRACYRAIFLTGRPLYTYHKAPTWSRALGWKRLILPIHDQETKQLCRFLVANVPVAQQENEASHLYRSSRL